MSLWDRQTKLSRHVPTVPGWEQEAAERARWHDDRGRDVYFGVCLRREGLSHYGRGKKRDLVAIPGFWMDIDIAGPGHAAKNLPPTVLGALGLLTVAPTITVHSGGGLHLYWLFEGGCMPLASPSDVRHYEEHLKALQGEIIAAGWARGWHVDATHDLTRVLRVPGTSNHK